MGTLTARWSAPEGPIWWAVLLLTPASPPTNADRLDLAEPVLRPLRQALASASHRPEVNQADRIKAAGNDAVSLFRATRLHFDLPVQLLQPKGAV